MPTLPTVQDMNKAREQAGHALEGAAHQARTPLMAALGAGDLAARAVADTVKQVREQLNESAGSAREGLGEIPGELSSLRHRLDPAELRKLIDSYTNSAVRVYGDLAGRGEDAFGRLRQQPRVQRAVDQVGNAQERFEGAVGDARDLADDVLGRVTTTTRFFGEKTARQAESTANGAAATVRSTAEDTADTVQEAGASTASTTRSAARKTANRTAAAKTNGSAKPQPKSAARKNNGN
ncbi:heparin binding hemagglutinin HbhA [Halopolyspora algeriensis]|uniref:Heparin binding hemagglutinin HbhA n=1 Tax=Halopolyspora algeriensis TaxID=1500506 RepID=A0A368VY60_9ACTN|nr:hypothetical protein [Halopolyspora algeriensis]RCW46927.1 heparin binding hemagglutinin HbhA [Halopolyspora algeriensis]TQM48018.1 heparin binding hemagglutinin HbhA [Halopolyspora algeriensis]